MDLQSLIFFKGFHQRSISGNFHLIRSAAFVHFKIIFLSKRLQSAPNTFYGMWVASVIKIYKLLFYQYFKCQFLSFNFTKAYFYIQLPWPDLNMQSYFLDFLITFILPKPHTPFFIPCGISIFYWFCSAFFLSIHWRVKALPFRIPFFQHRITNPMAWILVSRMTWML